MTDREKLLKDLENILRTNETIRKSPKIFNIILNAYNYISSNTINVYNAPAPIINPCYKHNDIDPNYLVDPNPTDVPRYKHNDIDPNYLVDYNSTGAPPANYWLGHSENSR